MDRRYVETCESWAGVYFARWRASAYRDHVAYALGMAYRNEAMRVLHDNRAN